MDEIATQLAAPQGADAMKQALAEVQATCKGIEDLLRQADTVTGIVAEIQRSQDEMTKLREFERLLDMWSSAYNRAIVSVVQVNVVRQFKDYLELIDAGKSLLRRLGIGNSIEQEIKVQRQLL